MNKELYSKEIERATLACIVIFKDCQKHIKIIEVEDFYLTENQIIMQLLKELKEEDSPINITTIKEKSKSKKLKEKEIFNYLVEISNEVITSAEIDYYIKTLKSYSMKRKILNATKRINDKVFTTEIDVDSEELKKECINEIVNIKTQTQELKNSDMFSVMNIVIDDIENRYKNRDDHTYETGFFDLDKATNGLHKQELTIIAARPRHWKDSTCIKHSRKISKQRSIYIFRKFRNVKRAVRK